MLRLTLLYLFVCGLAVVAVRRWFLALCGLVFLTVLTQHPNMPREIAGIQGLNPWNASFLAIFSMWILTRHNDPPRAQTPPRVALIVLSYASVLTLTGLTAVMDSDSMHADGRAIASARDVFVETIINPMKYLMVGIMFYDGATTRLRVKQAVFTAVGSGAAYAALMYKSLKTGVFTMDYSAARRATDKLVGLYANDMGEVLAFTLWAGLIAVLLIQRHWLKFGWLLANAAVVPCFAVLKSRAGFLAFCATGLVLGVLKWRRILLALPIVLLSVVVFAPNVVDRVMTGVASDGIADSDWDAISAGRTTYLWPAALNQFVDSPIFGRGRFTILRTGMYDAIYDVAGGVPTHPHNSYLEMLIDAGVIGLAICLISMAGLARSGLALMRQRYDPLMTAVGAIGLIGVVTELSAGVAGSSFYPGQSAVPYLCIWGVLLRAVVEKSAQAAGRRRACLIPTSTEMHSSPAMSNG
ncbi:MAG: O-antigen ligase family protein [Phycisphaerae bacterium]|nr:O-antigen ligase family protein [Phycisphaerae bacterium]